MDIFRRFVCVHTGCARYGTENEIATQESINSYYAIHRCIKYAFEYTKNNNRKKITLCAKTNVLTYAHDLWERIFYDVAKDYPEIETDYGHVDAVCMWMVKNPEWFDVIVTDNMFGDIITDLGAMIQGGMGIAAGGNINPEGVSMFEPIGGSAPKYTNKNVINPLACIGAAAMMVLQRLQKLKIILLNFKGPPTTQHRFRAILLILLEFFDLKRAF